jgi:hypothetical protein
MTPQTNVLRHNVLRQSVQEKCYRGKNASISKPPDTRYTGRQNVFRDKTSSGENNLGTKNSRELNILG